MNDEEILRPAQQEPHDPPATSPGTYTVEAVCSNCHDRSRYAIPRGTPLDRQQCRNCGTTNLQPLGA
jgi:cytochrome c5